MRPIGARIIQVCTIVEASGVCTSPQARAVMQIEATNVIKYLSRSVGFGLLTVDRTTKPHQYRAVEGWRERLKPVQRAIKPQAPSPERTDWKRVNSIFNMGAMA